MRWVMDPTHTTQRVEEDGRATAMGDEPRTQRVGVTHRTQRVKVMDPTT